MPENTNRQGNDFPGSIPREDLSVPGMRVFAEAISSFTTQITIQNTILSKIMDNTADNPELKELLSDIKKSSDKVVNFIESNEGLTNVLEKKGEKDKAQLKEAANYILLRIIIVIFGMGLIINTIVFWIQKIVFSDFVDHVVEEVVKKLQ